MPAKLILKDGHQCLQIQVCWDCRLELWKSAEDQLTKIANGVSVPHYAVHTWPDVIAAINRDDGVEYNDMVFWLRQSSFARTPPTFDNFCTASPEEYHALVTATPPPIQLDEPCLKCGKSRLLPIIINIHTPTQQALANAIAKHPGASLHSGGSSTHPGGSTHSGGSAHLSTHPHSSSQTLHTNTHPPHTSATTPSTHHTPDSTNSTWGKTPPSHYSPNRPVVSLFDAIGLCRQRQQRPFAFK